MIPYHFEPISTFLPASLSYGSQTSRQSGCPPIHYNLMTLYRTTPCTNPWRFFSLIPAHFPIPCSFPIHWGPLTAPIDQSFLGPKHASPSVPSIPSFHPLSSPPSASSPVPRPYYAGIKDLLGVSLQLVFLLAVANLS